jgi:hypothetical protein
MIQGEILVVVVKVGGVVWDGDGGGTTTLRTKVVGSVGTRVPRSTSKKGGSGRTPWVVPSPPPPPYSYSVTAANSRAIEIMVFPTGRMVHIVLVELEVEERGGKDG